MLIHQLRKENILEFSQSHAPGMCNTGFFVVLLKTCVRFGLLGGSEEHDAVWPNCGPAHAQSYVAPYTGAKCKIFNCHCLIPRRANEPSAEAVYY